MLFEPEDDISVEEQTTLHRKEWKESRKKGTGAKVTIDGFNHLADMVPRDAIYRRYPTYPLAGHSIGINHVSTPKTILTAILLYMVTKRCGRNLA